MLVTATAHHAVDSRYAWWRLVVAVVFGTVGGVGMWSAAVALPAVQADFGVARAEAALAYTVTMAGFACGGVVLGRLCDRVGMLMPGLLGLGALVGGYIGAGAAPTLWLFVLAHAFIGLGASVAFGPIIADTSQWFLSRRALAVAIASSGNYIAGALWPPVVEHFIGAAGWRAIHIGIGLFCALTMPPLLMLLRRRAPGRDAVSADILGTGNALRLSPNALQAILCLAGVCCCVAMSMPQVHIVAYCGDLGYAPARGAQMLALMLAFGIPSRLASGFVADRIGGVATLLLGSLLQGVALLLYLFFDSVMSLYVISALFGLFQGGIVAMYPVIVREYFPPQEAGVRVGLVFMATLSGMALGGWMSGALFDFTGSYQAAFLNGLFWNLANVLIMVWLLLRPGRQRMRTLNTQSLKAA
jgi:MFS family permease